MLILCAFVYVSTVANHLLEIGEVKFAGQILQVVKPARHCLLQEESLDGNDANPDEISDDDSIIETSSVILVRRIPEKMSEDTVKYFFENTRRSGGGNIAEIDFDETLRTALITFEDSQGLMFGLQHCCSRLVQCLR